MWGKRHIVDSGRSRFASCDSDESALRSQLVNRRTLNNRLLQTANHCKYNFSQPLRPPSHHNKPYTTPNRLSGNANGPPPTYRRSAASGAMRPQASDDGAKPLHDVSTTRRPRQRVTVRPTRRMALGHQARREARARGLGVAHVSVWGQPFGYRRGSGLQARYLVSCSLLQRPGPRPTHLEFQESPIVFLGGSLGDGIGAWKWRCYWFRCAILTVEHALTLVVVASLPGPLRRHEGG